MNFTNCDGCVHRSECRRLEKCGLHRAPVTTSAELIAAGNTPEARAAIDTNPGWTDPAAQRMADIMAEPAAGNLETDEAETPEQFDPAALRAAIAAAVVTRTNKVLKTKQLRIRTEPKLYREFQAVCRAQELGASEVARQMMRAYVTLNANLIEPKG